MNEEGMGEVRTRANLTNAVDEALARRGQLEESNIRSYTADAMIDTGAVVSVLPVHVVQSLGLLITGQKVVEYADGRKEPVDVTEPVTVEINGRKTTEETYVLGDEVLIGQTVLEKLDLLVDCSRRRLIPNPAHPDQPVAKVK